ncbi:MAG TPA: branched-chain amino acid ABC transporter permease [Candidatus Caldiarchaeum subterraneum]|uniref:Branched-chain amino acid ABC transporter permease n=1 Tax=Caldiarchaeum subterraneum TaxID=311458 RepID=A0A832ZX27_CALS0|nr:branched-chain amino acid ABC transporter permease [Aigarchaeota archaeon]HIQ30328.1 branched-chain amino acid ABC transporter permease [Candidatus Caldarchaeum subterraneum]
MSYIPVIIDGIVYGLQLSLLAVGITLIFGLGEILNLSHGEFAVIAGVTAAVLNGVDVNPFISALVGVLLAGVFGLIIEKTILISAYKATGETRILSGMFITLGLGFALHGYMANQFALVSYSVRLPIDTIEFLGMVFRPTNLVAGGISAITLILLMLLLKYTYFGKAVRSVVQNEIGAQLCGINPSRIRMIIFFIGTMLAGLAGIMQGLSSTIEPEVGVQLTIFAIIVSIVGGVRSVTGTIVAGILLGVVYSLVSFLIGTYIATIFFLLAAALTIVFRPEGLLGHKV